jgi:molybdopterin molybdotransferase
MADMLSVEEARGRLLAAARPVAAVETADTMASLGRVLAADQVSTVTVPPFDNSAMDGYAVRAAEAVAGACLPVSQRIPAGQAGNGLLPGTAARIFTGAPMPAGADAVVMQEDTEADGGKVRISRAPRAGENVRRAGEDIRAGDVALAMGARITPAAMGMAASVGLATLPVFRRVKVAVFFTGDELVMPGRPLAPGQIYNSNRYTLTGLLRRMDCEIRDYGIVPDNVDATLRTLGDAAGWADVVVTSGGVSVGEEDHVRRAVEQLGRIKMWKVAMKPGKPFVHGMVGEADFFGLPGNPVSAFVTFCLFVRPFLALRQGESTNPVRPLRVYPDFERVKAGKRREFLRARLLEGEGGTLKAAVYPNQSSGVLNSVVWADGLVDIPAGQTVARGDTVLFLPFAGMGVLW